MYEYHEFAGFENAGLKMKLLCKEMNLTPGEFASLIGVSRGMVFRWYNGTIPRPEHLELITEVLHISLEGLLSDCDQLNLQSS